MKDTVYTCSKCGENGFLNDFDMNNPDNACICNECYLKNPLPTKEEQKVIDEFVEEGANLEHKRWAGWQEYLHSKCIKTEEGALVIPPNYVDHWERQINTPYNQLTEKEKESDRKEVRKYIPLLLTALQAKEKEVLERVEECVPEEVKPINTDDIYRTTHRLSWNACRSQTLQNIKNFSK